ncbi:MAG: alpha/beta fold hydrolase [Polyangiaceae bacterium]
MPAEPTPKDTLFRDGTAKLYRFRGAQAKSAAAPVLLVPSLINRWYILDLQQGSSVASALVDAGLDVYCLDWGAPNDEDRYLDWDDLVDRLARMVRRVQRESGAAQVGVLGYCMGGTLSSIFAALQPERVKALVNLAGPIDFSEAGFLGHMTNPRWFDPEAIASAGNMRAEQMQAGFVALRPTAQLAKWVSWLDKLDKPERMEAFRTLEEWASANISFPAQAYVRYIRELYQQNALVQKQHFVRGERVDLANIRCPILTVVTDRDTICPPAAAQGLGKHAGSTDQELLVIPGGHVGAVVGPRAASTLYPKLAGWLSSKLA